MSYIQSKSLKYITYMERINENKKRKRKLSKLLKSPNMGFYESNGFSEANSSLNFDTNNRSKLTCNKEVSQNTDNLHEKSIEKETPESYDNLGIIDKIYSKYDCNDSDFNENEKSDPKLNLCTELIYWTEEEKIPYSSVNNLLQIIGKFCPNLPKDSRTIQKMARTNLKDYANSDTTSDQESDTTYDEWLKSKLKRKRIVSKYEDDDEAPKRKKNNFQSSLRQIERNSSSSKKFSINGTKHCGLGRTCNADFNNSIPKSKQFEDIQLKTPARKSISSSAELQSPFKPLKNTISRSKKLFINEPEHSGADSAELCQFATLCTQLKNVSTEIELIKNMTEKIFSSIEVMKGSIENFKSKISERDFEETNGTISSLLPANTRDQFNHVETLFQNKSEKQKLVKWTSQKCGVVNTIEECLKLTLTDSLCSVCNWSGANDKVKIGGSWVVKTIHEALFIHNMTISDKNVKLCIMTYMKRRYDVGFQRKKRLSLVSRSLLSNQLEKNYTGSSNNIDDQPEEKFTYLVKPCHRSRSPSLSDSE